MRQYLEISKEALDNIKALLVSNSDADGFKISIKSGGCSGKEYVFSFVKKDEVVAGCDLIEQDGVKIFIDPKAAVFLFGSKMTYNDGDFKSGFDFINPNENGRCGCGKSFNA